MSNFATVHPGVGSKKMFHFWCTVRILDSTIAMTKFRKIWCTLTSKPQQQQIRAKFVVALMISEKLLTHSFQTQPVYCTGGSQHWTLLMRCNKLFISTNFEGRFCIIHVSTHDDIPKVIIKIASKLILRKSV